MELFALGTAMYPMTTGHKPWPELSKPKDNKEIKKRICTKAFPDTSRLPVRGSVISKCWHAQFQSMTDVRHAIIAETQMDEPTMSENWNHLI
jgi:hypothetical protein